MAELMILNAAKSVLGKLASFGGEAAMTYVGEELKAAKSAKKDLKVIADKMEAICAVLKDADGKQFANEAIKIWLRDLKSIVYDIDDLLDEVAYDAELRKSNKGHFGRQARYYLSSSNPIMSRFHLSHEIKGLKEKLETIVAKKNDFGLTERPLETSRDDIRDPLDRSAFMHPPSIIGRAEAKNDILAKLLARGESKATELSVLPIVGMGGIGKTALVKLVYADAQHFDLKLWACVSDNFQLTKVIADIVKSGTGDTIANPDIDALVTKLRNLLNGKKYLLVLDDVWLEDAAEWAKLRDLLAIGEAGSVVLITTRSPSVASITQTMDPYNLNRLPDDVCWSIFERLAFKEGEQTKYAHLYEIGRSIIQKCCGIPLVVITLGSLLRTERDNQQWQRIHDMDGFLELDQRYDKVIQILKLSYGTLPSHLKLCFAYLSLFPKDHDLFSLHVSYMWSALGLLQVENGKYDNIENCGYSYFMELASRSLLQNADSVVDTWYEAKMHDLFHDMCKNILGEDLQVVVAKSSNMNLSEFARHIIWACEGEGEIDSSNYKEFSKNLYKARNARTFRFGDNNYSNISLGFLKAIICQFTCLRILDLSFGLFEELPRSIGNLKHLRYLDLSMNAGLRNLPDTISNLLYLEFLAIHGCEKLERIPNAIFRLQRLSCFLVTTLETSLEDKSFNELGSLHTLGFDSCERLASLWDSGSVGVGVGVEVLSSLRCLHINNCPKLASLPKNMKSLVRLEVLIIFDCEELDLENNGECLQGLQRLRVLEISKVPKLASLPIGIQSASATLERLFIAGCQRLVELPNWLQCFTSLRKIEINVCSNLLGLPLGFRNLSSLQELEINDCHHLSGRCVELTGEDYPLIQHVPKVKLDGIEFTSNTT